MNKNVAYKKYIKLLNDSDELNISNPYLNRRQCIGADPHTMFDPQSGYYYIYTSGNGYNNFYIYKTKDFVNLEFVGFPFEDDNVIPWAKKDFWAPECYYNPNNKKYYLFFSAWVNDDLVEKYFIRKDFGEPYKIGVAVADRPEGPFKSLGNLPIDYYPYDVDYLYVDDLIPDIFINPHDERLKDCKKGLYVPYIDVNLFIDDDGRMFMYFSRNCYGNCRYDEKLDRFIEESCTCGVELDTKWWFDKDGKTPPTIKDSYIGFDENGRRKDKYDTILSYSTEPQEWENGHIDDFKLSNGERRNRRWAEGPTMYTRIINGKKKYCVTYSCNFYMMQYYGVGIAFSDYPNKGFKKYDLNPVINQEPEHSLYSTGHGSINTLNGKDYYIFHGRDDVNNLRIIYSCELDVNEKRIHAQNIKQCVLANKDEILKEK